MNFTAALEAIQANTKMRRPNWAEDVYVYYLPGKPDETLTVGGATTVVTYPPQINMRVTGGQLVKYAAPSEDVLATDWEASEWVAPPVVLKPRV